MVNSYMQLQEYYREKELVFNLTNVSKVQVSITRPLLLYTGPSHSFLPGSTWLGSQKTIEMVIRNILYPNASFS